MLGKKGNKLGKIALDLLLTSVDGSSSQALALL